MTWNVWFGLEKPVGRWSRLLADLRSLRADLIALQEVTDPFLEMLRKEPWVRKSYAISDPRGEGIASYGCLLLSRLPVVGREVVELESEMERKLALIDVEVRGEVWTIGSVHLESLDSAAVRGRQLEQVCGRLGSGRDTLLCGDFNFCSSWTEENDRLPSDFVDVWPAVGDGPGFTVDTERNAMRARNAKGDRRERFDRILLRSAHARPTRARLLGTEPVKGESPALFPSDHFGVYAELALSAR